MRSSDWEKWMKATESERVPRATNFWREYKTQCSNCGKLDKHKRGFLYTAMAPSGEMKTFCDVDCCTEWEQKGDNTNSRREAIKKQKAKKRLNSCTE